MTETRPSADDRFATKYQVDPETGCWIWTAGRDGYGYGLFSAGRTIRAHIFSYERKYGATPAGLVLDHFACDTPSCCNPDHVRPVSRRENTLRSEAMSAVNLAKEKCPQGHPYDSTNTYAYDGKRSCKVCILDHQRRYRAANREKVAKAQREYRSRRSSPAECAFWAQSLRDSR